MNISAGKTMCLKSCPWNEEEIPRLKILYYEE
jgi:hypothetical protein